MVWLQRWLAECWWRGKGGRKKLQRDKGQVWSSPSVICTEYQGYWSVAAQVGSEIYCISFTFFLTKYWMQNDICCCAPEFVYIFFCLWCPDLRKYCLYQVTLYQNKVWVFMFLFLCVQYWALQATFVIVEHKTMRILSEVEDYLFSRDAFPQCSLQASQPWQSSLSLD